MLAHGIRSGGTSGGTFVVPKGLDIHFYTQDEEVLWSDDAFLVIEALTKGQYVFPYHRWFLTESAAPYSQVPNYIAQGSQTIPKLPKYDSTFRGNPTGLYMLPQWRPIHFLGHGTKITLEEVIYGIEHQGAEKHMTGELHWLCCRENLDPLHKARRVRPSRAKKTGEWRKKR